MSGPLKEFIKLFLAQVAALSGGLYNLFRPTTYKDDEEKIKKYSKSAAVKFW
jgi:hypothetical protein